jgi:hypothetical protein
MSSLIEKLKAGKRNIKRLEYPGTDQGIGITVLSEAETQEAVFASERLFKEHLIEVSATTADAYVSELNTQILFRALVNPAVQKKDGSCERYFSDVDEFRGMLMKDAKGILIDEYNAFQDECSPSPLKMSENEIEALVEKIKKNQMPGSGLSFRMLRELTTYLACRHQASQKDSGSTSSE